MVLGFRWEVRSNWGICNGSEISQQRNLRKRSPPCSMYAHSQHMDVSVQVAVVDDNGTVGAESVDNPHIRYDGHSFEDRGRWGALSPLMPTRVAFSKPTTVVELVEITVGCIEVLVIMVTNLRLRRFKQYCCSWVDVKYLRLHKAMNWHLKASGSYKMKYANLGRRTPRTKTLWHDIKCPIQKNAIDCGYYVFKFMKDLVLDQTSSSIIPINWYGDQQSEYLHKQRY